MKYWLPLFILAASFATTVRAATINWSAGINHGFSLQNGSELPVGSLVRLGWFRDPATGAPLTDVQIQALKTSTASLDAKFVEAGRSTIGSGFTPAYLSHFAAASSLDTGSSGLSLAGKQMYIWVLNAATVEAATQQAILYWTITDTSTNPDGTSDTPGVRWSFPAQESFPGSTTIDITDLTIGTGSLAAGARLVVGTYPNGTSSTSGKANFGLADLYQNPLVSTPRTLPGGSVGVVYSQALAVIEGTPGYSWDVIGGALPDGLALNSAGVISGRPTFAGIYTFMARASDQVPNSVSKQFTITIASTPLAISNPATLPEGGQDALYALPLTATGGTAPYTWTIASGALPDGLTLSGAGLLSGSPTGTGSSTFVVKCADGGALETSQEFTLVVRSVAITTGATLNNGILNVPYVQTLAATGGKPPYTWTLSSGALPPGLPPGVLLSSTGVLSFTPTTEGTSTFTLQVQDNAGRTASKDFSLSVLLSPVVPTLSIPSLPKTIVGGNFYYKLSASDNPTRFTASNLPPGLSIVAATGVISGRPTAMGLFTIQLKAYNSAGPSAAVVAKLEVQALPTGAIGSFIGNVAHNSSLNNNLGARLDLTTTKLGAYTLKLTKTTRSSTTFTGKMDSVPGQNPVINVRSGTIVIALTLDAASNSLTGTMTETAVGGSSASVAGWRRVWTTASNPASAHIGYYSMGIDLTTTGSKPVPLGTGFAWCQVGLDGGLTVTGKTSDGSAFSTAGFVGPNGEVLVYQVLYSDLGSLVGRLKLTPDAGGLFTENTLTGSLTWLKPATASRSYPLGFGPLTMSVYGKYLANFYKGRVVIGLPSSLLAAHLNFAAGGVEASTTNPDVQFTYNDKRQVLLPTPGGLANPGRTTLSLPFIDFGGTANNGMMSGSFQLLDGTTKRTVTYQGMIVRTPDSTTKAFGYFLLPQLPAFGQNPATTPILSGQVTITQ